MLSSPTLTIIILVYSVLMIFLATIAQKEIGIAQAQEVYFESLFAMGNIAGFHFPIIGGGLVGILAFINILTAGIRFARFGLEGLGISLTHMALALLIISGGLQYFMREEAKLMLAEGEQSNLLFIAPKAPSKEPETIALPFSVELVKFTAEKWEGSSIPKSYSSQLIFRRGDKSEEFVVKMNNPVSYAGWTFFQASYRVDEKGKVYSILSAVKNPARLLPWLSVGAVFVGMIIIFVPRVFKRGKYGD